MSIYPQKELLGGFERQASMWSHRPRTNKNSTKTCYSKRSPFFLSPFFFLLLLFPLHASAPVFLYFKRSLKKGDNLIGTNIVLRACGVYLDIYSRRKYVFIFDVHGVINSNTQLKYLQTQSQFDRKATGQVSLHDFDWSLLVREVRGRKIHKNIKCIWRLDSHDIKFLREIRLVQN